MSSVAVVSDSACSLPRDIAEAEGIQTVSLYVNFAGERTERESDLMSDLGALYDELRSADQWPTTSQPSIGDFTSVYEPLLAEGRDVVSVHISSDLPSGTCDAARQAAEMLARDGKGGERIRVIDSRSVAGGLGLVALAGARAAGGGADADAVVARVEEAREELKLWFALDTLEFLRRSGRVGAASAWIGSTLKIKPILTVESQVLPVERVRTAARALERLVAYAEQREAAGADAWVVQHIQSPDQAKALVERCREIFGNDAQFVSEIGPVLGVHSGPGMLGFGAIPSRLLA